MIRKQLSNEITDAVMFSHVAKNFESFLSVEFKSVHSFYLYLSCLVSYRSANFTHRLLLRPS